MNWICDTNDSSIFNGFFFVVKENKWNGRIDDKNFYQKPI